MTPNILPILALFLPGFVAMEIAYYLGPRNFRSNSESYKYVVAILLGTIIFGSVSLISGSGLAAGAQLLAHPETVGAGRVIGTGLVTLFVGWAWHMFFSHIAPRWYADSGKRNGDGGFAVYHGPNRVFDQAMVHMDKLPVEVYLKDRRVLEGWIIAYPDVDGDSGLLLEIRKRGHLPDLAEFRQAVEAGKPAPTVLYQPPLFEPVGGATSSPLWRPWEPIWDDCIPDDSQARNSVFIAGPMIEYVSATRFPQKKDQPRETQKGASPPSAQTQSGAASADGK